MNLVEQNLKERHVQPERYSVSWDDETACFLLFNLSGKIVGYQNYKWWADKTRNNDPRESRYYTYSSNPKFFVDSGNSDCLWIQKTDRNCRELAVFGLETYFYRTDILFMVEGIMDAVRLHNLGLPAIALLSNDPKHLKYWFPLLNRLLIVITDDDKAGQLLGKYGDIVLTLSGGRDLGDMSDREVKKLVKEYLK